MKIGIMTFFRPINYGAYLQAYALSHKLNQEKDIEAEIINYHMPVEDELYNNRCVWHGNIFRTRFNRKKSQVFHKMLDCQILSTQECCSANLDDFVSFVDKKYDIIIAGSDEIWKIDGYRGFSVQYFLPGELHCKKVSYAASSRSLFDKLSFKDQKLIKKCLDAFDYIGVRDLATKKEVEKIIKQKNKIHLNYDPCFIYDFKPDVEKGRVLLKKYFRVSSHKKIIAFMFNEKIFSKPNFELYLKKRYGRNFQFISLYDWCWIFKNSPEITPFEWIDIIAAVDGVISMYYHGICFSMITGTPFFAVDKLSKNNDESKLYDLMNRCSLLDYYSLGVKNIIEEKKLDNFMNKILQGWRYDSSFTLVQARDEFNEFVNELRKINSES